MQDLFQVQPAVMVISIFFKRNPFFAAPPVGRQPPMEGAATGSTPGVELENAMHLAQALCRVLLFRSICGLKNFF